MALSDIIRNIASNVVEEVRNPRLRTAVYAGALGVAAANTTDIAKYVYNDWENFARNAGTYGLIAGGVALTYTLGKAAYQAFATRTSRRRP